MCNPSSSTPPAPSRIWTGVSDMGGANKDAIGRSQPLLRLLRPGEWSLLAQLLAGLCYTHPLNLTLFWVMASM